MHWIKLQIGIKPPIALMLAGMLLSGCTIWPLNQPDSPADQALDQALDPETAALQSAFDAALAHMQAGQWQAAETGFLAIHQTHPKLTGPLLNLGLIARANGQTDQAQDRFQQILTLQPAHRHALNLLGVMAREQGDFAKAEAWYRQALAADPQFAPAIRNLAILLDLYQGRKTEALALYLQYQTLGQTSEQAPAESAEVPLKDWIFDLKTQLEQQP